MSRHAKAQSRLRHFGCILLDVLFALWPLASAWVIWNAVTSSGGFLVAQETPWKRVPPGFFAAFVLMVLIFGCIVWCCSCVDRRYHGWKKALWYAVIVFVWPFGCPLYWFTRMRDSVSGRSPPENIGREEYP